MKDNTTKRAVKTEQMIRVVSEAVMPELSSFAVNKRHLLGAYL